MWTIEGFETRPPETVYRSTASAGATENGSTDPVVSTAIYSFSGGASEAYLNGSARLNDLGTYNSMTADAVGVSYYGAFISAGSGFNDSYTSSTSFSIQSETQAATLSTTKTGTTGYLPHLYEGTQFSTHIFLSSYQYTVEVNSTSTSTVVSKFTTSALQSYATQVFSLGTETFSSSYTVDASGTSSENSSHSYTGTRVVLSDCATGTVQATTKSSYSVQNDAAGAVNFIYSQKIDHFLFGPNEWAWSFIYTREVDQIDDDPDDGVFALNEIAEEITESSWRVPTSTKSTYTTGAGDRTYTYLSVGMYLEYSTWTQSFTIISTSTTTDQYGDVAVASSTATGMDPNLHGGYDQLPTPAGETFLVPWTYSTTYSVSARMATTTVAGNTVSVTSKLTGTSTTDDTGGTNTYSYLGTASVTTTLAPLAGFSGVSTFAVELARETTTSTAYYDASGNIVDSGGVGTGDFSSETATTESYVTTASMVIQGLAPLSSSSSSAQDGYSTYYTAQGGFSSTTERSIPIYHFSSYLATALILEASFTRALRFGTNGKYDQITGPGAPCYYPFFSQVWSGLWMPMTFSGTKSATWQGSTTATDGDYEVDLTDNPISTLTYSWGRTNDVRGVTISASWQTTQTFVGTDGQYTTSAGGGGTSSTAFTIGAVNENDSSFYSVWTFNPFYATQANDEQFALGGKQWDGNDHMAILGRGIWQVTTNDSTGGTTTDSFKVTDSSLVTVGSDSIVAFRPRPAFETVGGLDTPEQRLYVTNKWNFD